MEMLKNNGVENFRGGFSGSLSEEQEILNELNKYSEKNQVVAMILCIVFAGAQYYYVGRIGKGLLYTFTGGFFLIGTFLDFFVIASGNFKDAQGRYLNMPKREGLLLKLRGVR
ncbi:MAG: TM2 domain-containing protein [Roseburia sp.]|nr:TM2 domain-containing protein [Roseburia sp.]